ncbi:MAG: glycogen/starch/alpha-glucan phosphorylase [Ruminococcaceae bacterium]|nr:glycogen/starch/alpha-glucan phosphorylase [Oscillospiraceae bacterium]
MSEYFDVSAVQAGLEGKLLRQFGCGLADATREQMYKAVALCVKELLTERRAAFKKKVSRAGAKQVYYLCMEFLLGRSLKNHLCNLGLEDTYRRALSALGFSLDELYECEPDAGLGNGGLGRLAACFMDALATGDYPATGFSICYDYGLFRQMIVDGVQVELPDVWLPGGEVFLQPRTDRIQRVHLGGHIREEWREGHLEILYEGGEEIEAVPYDMMISGAGTETVAGLRLWRARNIQNFNMGLFSQGEYMKALEKSNSAEILSKVLYPTDNHAEGKLLRLSQQYFLVSASCQSILRDHMSVYGMLDNLPEKVAIHINDTHPALVIPELMRIFLDEYHFTWEKAWDIVTRTVSYTNHTVMPEALECWSEDLFALRLPRIHSIVKEINERFCRACWAHFPGEWEKISGMSILSGGQVRMANLSVVGSHAVNGVSALHSDILKKTVFRDFYRMYPERFCNVTNGVAHRRFLNYHNPRLAALLDECIGEGYRKDPQELARLADFAKDRAVLDKLGEIKRANKEEFCAWLSQKRGKVIDPAALFDVQIKRLHEYKRQLLNALHIIGLYLDLRENPALDMQPRVFLFGAKAAPGYEMAKRIIKLICMLEKEIDAHPAIKEKLRVVFLEDYNVTLAERLIPATELSEQISTAGKEASGTGCMKLMMNGALTIGTADGANVEIGAAVGEENIFLFGHSATEVEELWARGYQAAAFYTGNERLMRIVSALGAGFGGESFADIATYLLAGNGVADPYLCLADFEAYRHAQSAAAHAYRDPVRWNRMSLCNIAASGYFSADRSIAEYAARIWHIAPLQEEKC